jgi:hypothetical protein
VTKTRIGTLEVSRLVVGGNPFSGISHQSPDRDEMMFKYFTAANIKAALAEATLCGASALLARADAHITRLVGEYRGEGGRIAWIAQTCPEFGEPAAGVDRAFHWFSPDACYIHGGVMDHLVATGKTDEAKRGIERIRKEGVPAGVAGHTPRVFEWAERNLQVDFYMCSYYNPTPREADPEHPRGAVEMYLESDRAAVTKTIAALSKPAIHYKIMAAGRNKPEEAFAYCGAHLRPQDLVCIGVFPGDDGDMIAKDAELFRKYCEK